MLVSERQMPRRGQASSARSVACEKFQASSQGAPEGWKGIEAARRKEATAERQRWMDKSQVVCPYTEHSAALPRKEALTPATLTTQRKTSGPPHTAASFIGGVLNRQVRRDRKLINGCIGVGGGFCLG